MAGLFHSLNIGSQSLFANRQGVDTTAHNIANAQTEGFSRQDVKITQREPSLKHGILIGNGVYVGSIDRSHDKFVERQVNHAATELGRSEAKLSAINDIESIFSPELPSISDELNGFFTALQNLSKYPEELTARAAVREQGKSLTESFRRVDFELRRYRTGLNEHIEMTAADINKTVKSIADLNVKIRELEVGPQSEANDLRDQRDLLLRNLNNLVGVHYYEDKDGMVTVHGPSNTLMVDRGHASTLQVKQNIQNEGLFDIYMVGSGGGVPRNVTRQLGGGRLQGLVEVRDEVAGGLVTKNNEMAATLASRFNAVHRQGFGLEDYRFSSGRNFFTETSDIKLAAQDINLDMGIMNSTDAISVASLQNTPGDNVVANLMLGVEKENLFPKEGGASLSEFYADYVSVLGVEAVRAQHLKDSDDIIYADLLSRREAVAGVSLDEEAANMIRWQTAFTASSKVITTVDEMLETVLNLKR